MLILNPLIGLIEIIEEELVAAGYDMQQSNMMAENVILVSEADEVMGSASKKETHYKNGSLHRAFSVLIFNEKHEILLQKRCSGKITFPSVWANACCSHPLHVENELIESSGIKNAAIRKLNQELGIPSEQLSSDDIHYMTRMHYSARYNSEMDRK